MNIFLDSIGCRLNQSEIESIARQFRLAGHTIVDDAAGADLAIINTCTVTANAAADSRKSIRRAAQSGHAQVIATGCWASVDFEQAIGMPENLLLIPNERKDNLVAEVLNPNFSLQELQKTDQRRPLPGHHMRTRAFIKIQDGCDNHCTFCITRIARGRSKSRPLTDVMDDIRWAIHGQAQEIVLCGVNLGSWGRDFEHPAQLQYLIENILQQTSIQRIRLSSLEPWELGNDFFSLWKDSRLCRHLHLSLQSGSGTVLKRMVRKNTTGSYQTLVENIRAVSPDMAITTDIIVGFPGETEQEFTESVEFVKEMQFAGGHVFNFSARPGTPAARLPEQVPPAIRKQRSALMRQVISKAEEQYRQKFLHKQVAVLWENATWLPSGQWLLEGLSDNYLRVRALADQSLWNHISRVEIQQMNALFMQGIIL